MIFVARQVANVNYRWVALTLKCDDEAPFIHVCKEHFVVACVVRIRKISGVPSEVF